MLIRWSNVWYYAGCYKSSSWGSLCVEWRSYTTILQDVYLCQYMLSFQFLTQTDQLVLAAVHSNYFTQFEQLIIKHTFDALPNAEQNHISKAIALRDQYWWFADIYPWFTTFWNDIENQFLITRNDFPQERFPSLLIEKRKPRYHLLIFVGFNMLMRNPFSVFFIFYFFNLPTVLLSLRLFWILREQLPQIVAVALSSLQYVFYWSDIPVLNT